MLCNECGKNVEAIKTEDVREIKIKDKTVQAKITTLICPECGEEIYDRETEEKTIWSYEQGSIQDYAHDNFIRLKADKL